MGKDDRLWEVSVKRKGNSGRVGNVGSLQVPSLKHPCNMIHEEVPVVV